MFLMVEEQGSRCPCLNPPLLFISKVHRMPCSHTKFQDIDTIICLYVLMKDLLGYSSTSTTTTDATIFLLGHLESPTRGKKRKRIKNNNGNCKAFCITRKRSKVERIHSAKINLVIN